MNQNTRYLILDPTLRWLETILAERFGHSFHLLRVTGGLRLQLTGSDGAIVFDTLSDGLTEAGSDQPCTQWNAGDEGWVSILGEPLLPAPGAFQLPSPLIEKRMADYVVHYDILGLTYWMLARVEEISRTDLDQHQRFPATSAHALKHGYLERPIVDEWLHILGQVIQLQWPDVEVRKHRFQMRVSHDVDRPSRYGFASLKNLARRMVGDLVRGNFASGLSGPWVRINSKSKLHPADPFNTFDWIMDQSEEHGLTSAFYFICGHTSTMDGEYQIEDPAIRDLLRRIHTRGHEIGLHPSYNTYNRPDEIKDEANRLKRVCAEEGIQQNHWGGRMHYLRWRHPETLRAWADASMDYDSTLSYADHAGFRCGTCFEYPGFDPVKAEALLVRVRPLIVMEASVLSKQYMGRNESDALAVFQDLKSKCQKLSGQFTLLWHNSEFVLDSQRNLFKKVISC
ncbi:polysaccharide deacetylase family protein [Akkermansiaceae bacterium]|nr:polysaccharide deacetylase family protein [Akkermansiaceae bacterium]